MHETTTRLLFGSLLGIVLGGCPGPEEKAQELLDTAVQLVRAAQAAEQRSYSEALTLYQQALTKAGEITTRYTTSPLAGRLASGETKVGPHTLTELKDRVVPYARVKAEAESDPLVCALFLASRIPPTTLIVGTDERLDWRPEAMTKIVEPYARAGQCERLLRVTDLVGVVLPRDWLLAAMIPPCVETGQRDQALAAAMALADTYQPPELAPRFFFTKAEALAEVAISYAQTGQAEQAALVVSHSVQAALTPKRSDFDLKRIAYRYAEAGYTDAAVQLAMSMEDGTARAEMISAIAYRYVQKDQPTQAFAVAMKMEKPSFVLSEIARRYVTLGHYDQALQVTKAIADPHYVAATLAKIAGGYMQAGQQERAAELLSQAREAANRVEHPYDRVWALVAIASQHLRAGQREPAMEVMSLALQTANAMEELEGVFPSRVNALSIVAGAYAEAGYYEQAFAIARSVGASLEMEVNGIVREYAEAGRCGRAREIAEGAIRDTAARTRTLREIAGVCLQTGQEGQLLGLLSRTLELAQAIEEGSKRVSELTQIANLYARTGRQERSAEILSSALAVATQGDPDDSAVKNIADSYAEIGDYRQALVVAGGIRDLFLRSSLLADIARRAAQAKQYDLVLQIADTVGEGIAASMEESYARESQLAEVAHLVLESGYYDQARKIAGKITSNYQLGREVMAEIGHKYVQAGRYEQALEIASAMGLPNLLCEVGRAYAKTGHYDRALQIAAMVPSFPTVGCEVGLLADIAEARARAGQQEQAAEHLLQALAVAHRAEQEVFSKAQALAVVGARYVQAGIEVDVRARRVLHRVLRELEES